MYLSVQSSHVPSAMGSLSLRGHGKKSSLNKSKKSKYSIIVKNLGRVMSNLEVI